MQTPKAPNAEWKFPPLLAEQDFRYLTPWQRPRKTRRGSGMALEREESAGRMGGRKGHRGKRFYPSVSPEPRGTPEPQGEGWGRGCGEWLNTSSEDRKGKPCAWWSGAAPPDGHLCVCEKSHHNHPNCTLKSLLLSELTHLTTESKQSKSPSGAGAWNINGLLVRFQWQCEGEL